jgi:hypothetical protein
MERTILRGGGRLQSPAARRMFRLMALGNRDLLDFVDMVHAVVLDRVFDGTTDRAHAVGVYERHVTDVRATVPADRLLVFDVAQGWEPLCAFLGVPVPDEPFPHVNDAAAFRRWQATGMARRLLPLAAAAGLALATLVTAGILALRRRRA